jgi:hypothetical protein
MFWEIDNFVIQSDIFRRFFICKNILKKLLCYHDNYFKYFTFGKYNGFVGEGFCMHVFSSTILIYHPESGWHVTSRNQGLSFSSRRSKKDHGTEVDPLGSSILDEARDQPIPGSFLKTLGTRLPILSN